MTITVEKEVLKAFCMEALMKSGMNPENAETVSKALVQTEMWGIHTHGVKNLYGYIEKAEAGGVSFTDRPFIERESGAVAVIDGNNTMGFISSTMAMNKACDLAKDYGISMVLVKNSCHFGACGYYANIAASRGMIGIVASNVDKKMTIPGARGMVMGHNPFALAAPAMDFPSVILDISSSNVASLRVLKAKEKGESIPDTWISDAEGKPTTDPSRYPEEGALLPMGGHKGYGIALFVEILTSVLLGGPISTQEDVKSWCFDLDRPNGVSHSFLAINPGALPGGDLFISRVQALVNDLHNAPKAIGNDSITVPGERMWRRFDQAEQRGLDIPDDVADELIKLEKKTGLLLPKLQL